MASVGQWVEALGSATTGGPERPLHRRAIGARPADNRATDGLPRTRRTCVIELPTDRRPRGPGDELRAQPDVAPRGSAARFLWRWAAGVAIVLSAACGASAPVSDGSTPSPAEAVGSAETLLKSLPHGADRCVVSRPNLVASRRRPLVGQIASHAELAWDSQLPASVVVTVGRTDENGHRAQATLMRTTTEPEVVRAQLESRPLVAIRFSGCHGSECLAARFLNRRTVAVSRGRFPTRTAVGVEARCLALLRQHPDALEISVSRDDLLLDEGGERRGTIETVIRLRGDRMELSRRTDRDSPEAFGVPDTGVLTLGAFGLLGGVLAEDVEREGRADSAIVRMRFHFDDLELAQGDAQRLARARVEDARARRPLAVAQVPIHDLATVRAQLRLHEEALSRSDGPARVEAGRQMAELLRRALTLHGDETELSIELARLLLGLLDAPAEALSVIERAMANSAYDRDALRPLRREALAHVSAEGLTDALSEDLGLDRDVAGRLAMDLGALAEGGVGYDVAEMVGRELSAVAPDGDLGPTRASARLPVAALADGFILLAELMIETPALLLVRGQVRAAPLGSLADTSAEDRRTPLLLPLHDARGRAWLAGVVHPTDVGRRVRLSRAIAESLLPGRAEFVVYAAAQDAPADEVLHVAGRMEGRFFHPTEGDWIRHGDWGAIARYVVQPLEGIGSRVFPAPELFVTASSGEDVSAIVAAASHEQMVCQQDGLVVRCVAARDMPGAARAALLRFAHDRLGGSLRRLRRP